MAEEDAAAKGDLKVVCEGVTRNLGLRDVGRVRKGDDAFLILFLYATFELWAVVGRFII